MYNEHVKSKLPRIFSIPNLLIIIGLILLGLSFGPLIRDELWYIMKELKNQEYSLTKGSSEEESVFAKLISSSTVKIEPVSMDFSIVIEKIGVNAHVIENVSVNNEEEYMEALKYGVAHAISSDTPSEFPGNVYLFAHASLNFFKLGKHATVFNLLRKLEYGDKIHVFYKGSEYIYSVIDKNIVKGWDITPLTRAVVEPVLTLQTCDPPGTTLNRLIVTSKLLEVIN